MNAYRFTLTGGPIPREHGYPLFSGLCRQFPFIHDRPDIQIAPVRGDRDGDNLKLRRSFLHIRGLSGEEALKMTNSALFVGGRPVFLRGVETVDLSPTPNLVSRLVVFNQKDDLTKERFDKEIQARLPLSVSYQIGPRRGIRIKGHTDVGHQVHLICSTAEESLSVLTRGLGKHTSMGCGVFYPGSDKVWRRQFGEG